MTDTTTSPAPTADVPEPAPGVVDCAVYRDGRREGGHLSVTEALAQCREPGKAFVWIGLHDPDEEGFAAVSQAFDLHPLAVEDAVHAHQRPKLEAYGETLFLVLKTVRYVDTSEVVDIGEVMVFTGPDFVITVGHGAAAGLADVRRQLEATPDVLAIGPDVVMWALADRIVDGYGPAAQAVDDDVDEVEADVFSTGSPPTERIYKLKREVLEFKRAVRPLVEPMARLASGSMAQLDPRTVPYFRDVSDHAVRAAEAVDGLDELLNGVLQANLAQVSMRQNDDMRKISAWAGILTANTFVAGVYGMNFEHMPELGWRYGYLYALVLMAAMSFVLWRGFRRNAWL
jgi:magnesium transporter